MNILEAMQKYNVRLIDLQDTLKLFKSVDNWTTYVQCATHEDGSSCHCALGHLNFNGPAIIALDIFKTNPMVSGRYTKGMQDNLGGIPLEAMSILGQIGKDGRERSCFAYDLNTLCCQVIGSYLSFINNAKVGPTDPTKLFARGVYMFEQDTPKERSIAAIETLISLYKKAKKKRAA